MPENNMTSVVDLIKERVVTSASARENVDSQGTTGLLNIIDQNQHSIHQKPPTSNHEGAGRGLLASRQLVFESNSQDKGAVHKGYNHSQVNPQHVSITQAKNSHLGMTMTTQFSKTGGDGVMDR